MNSNEATRLIRETFEQPFDESRFRYFARELLNQLDESKASTFPAQFIAEGFKEHVRMYKRLGTYTDPNGRKIDVLVVYLLKESTLTQARTMQRNFIARHLKTREEKDAALVAYASPDMQDWRFSLVRMEYQLKVDEKTGKVKPEEDLTPARRFSFLVGANEPNHTAQQQLIDILSDDRHNPTLDALEMSFSIETVTKQFFNDYKDRFLELKEALDSLAKTNPAIRKVFDGEKVTTANFAKKLLGQIVFLYFLQKKGWLGVQNEQLGPRNFLRQLFEREWGNYRNFFTDMLEPLFYESLAVERPGNRYEPLNCEIPFLNGGLFEPVEGYDWQAVRLPLDNALFGNIFDTFDLYNFTVREDEPLEKEVAVDPEMLGKVFENLLEVTDRKSKGAFYTPREIVHYMCQESLINYLDTALNLRPDPLARPEPVQGDLFVTPKPRQKTLETLKYDPVLPREDIDALIRKGEMVRENEAAKEGGAKTYDYQLPETIRRYAREIDQALADVKICDPAIGSGAFPVGMMQEIVRTREVLTVYLGASLERTLYNFKRHAIQNSLYGVDIDPGAVDIAKLRLWLSLVVDENDFKNIKPLPNLGYKILVGNSLLSQSIEVFNYQDFEKLESLKGHFFNSSDPKKKQELQIHIDQIVAMLLPNETFSFKVFFSEVFHVQGGFDIFIANPPYGIVFDADLKSQYEKRYSTFKRNNDIYVAFYESGLELIKDFGQLVFITPNTFLNGDYFKKLRLWLTSKSKIKEIRDFKEIAIFDDPTVFVCICNLEKSEQISFPYIARYMRAKGDITFFERKYFEVKQPSDSEFKESNPLLTRLRTEAKFTSIESRFYVKDVGFNYWTKGRGKKRTGQSIGKRILYAGKQEDSNDLPYLKGSNITKWKISAAPTQYLRHNYPSFLDEEDSFRFSSNFLKIKPKLIYRQTANTIIAAIDHIGYLTDKTVHLIVPKFGWRDFSVEVLAALMNSRLFAYLYAYISQETKGRAFAQVKTTYIKRLPIPIKTDNSTQKELELLVREAENAHANSINEIEFKIDQIVYSLYELSDDEIKIVEESMTEM